MAVSFMPKTLSADRIVAKVKKRVELCKRSTILSHMVYMQSFQKMTSISPSSVCLMAEVNTSPIPLDMLFTVSYSSQI
eukprot:1155211-Pelagomonas_calceolata.AAC.4